MTISAEMIERHDRMLGELAELAMDLARDLAARAKGADSLEEAERHARGFERLARCVRLTLGLQRRLHADARKDWSAERTTAVELRKAQVRASVRQTIRETWPNQFAMPRIERERELDERLAEEALHQAFLDAPVEAVIARIRERLSLPQAPPLARPQPETPSVGFADSFP